MPDSISIALGQAAVGGNKGNILGRNGIRCLVSAVDGNIVVSIFYLDIAILGLQAAGNINIGLDRIYPILILPGIILYPIMNGICSYTASWYMTAFNLNDASLGILGYIQYSNGLVLMPVGLGNFILGLHGDIVQVYLATWIAYSNIVYIQGQAGVILYVDIWFPIGSQGTAAIEVVSGNIDIAPGGCQLRQVNIVDSYILDCHIVAILIRLHEAGLVQQLHYPGIILLITDIGSTWCSISLSIISLSRSIFYQQGRQLLQALDQAGGIAIGPYLEIGRTNSCGVGDITVLVGNLHYIAKLLDLRCAIFGSQLHGVVSISHYHIVMPRYLLVLALVISLALVILLRSKEYPASFTNGDILVAGYAGSYAAGNIYMVIIGLGGNLLIMGINIVLAISLSHIDRLGIPIVGTEGTAEGVEDLLACIGIEVGILDRLNLAANIDNIVLALLVIHSWYKAQWHNTLIVCLSIGIHLQAAQLVVDRLAGIEIYILAAINIACYIQGIGSVNMGGTFSANTTSNTSNSVFRQGLVGKYFLVVGSDGNIAVSVNGLQGSAASLGNLVGAGHIHGVDHPGTTDVGTMSINLSVGGNVIIRIGPILLLTIGGSITQLGLSRITDIVGNIGHLDIDATIAIAAEDIVIVLV